MRSGEVMIDFDVIEKYGEELKEGPDVDRSYTGKVEINFVRDLDSEFKHVDLDYENFTVTQDIPVPRLLFGNLVRVSPRGGRLGRLSRRDRGHLPGADLERSGGRDGESSTWSGIRTGRARRPARCWSRPRRAT